MTVEAETLADGGRVSWTPRCGLTALGVPVPPSAGYLAMFWAVESDARLIAPGIRYGTRPEGTRTTTPAQPLARGSTHTLWLYGAGRQQVAAYSWRM